MNFLSDTAIRSNMGWNERPLGEDDFYKFCRRSKITVEEMPLRVSGFYYRLLGRDFIAIDSRLTGNERLKVMFHELAHFLFHTPESGATANFHRIGRKTRQEMEADAFALCAIIPLPMINDLDGTRLEQFDAKTLEERRTIFERYGI